MINIIEISDLKKIKEEINIIDIRDEYSFEKGHIKNAKNIVENKLLLNPQKYLKKEEIYYIYCTNGYRSKQVVKHLKILGYNAINIKGGYNNYLLSK